MKHLLIAVALLTLLGCATLGITYSGGDGSSFEQAVVITGAYDTDRGIGAENAWIRKTYPRSQKVKQALKGSDGKAYDIITIVTADGDTRDVYFDITAFFGKF